MHPSKKILFLASEADPFIKVGGLGDVAGSLPYAFRALCAEGCDIRLVIPFHTVIRSEGYSLQRETVFSIPRQGGDIPVQAFRTEIRGLTIYLISGAPISSSLTVYDSSIMADGEKFTFFSLAALELARKLDWKPDIVHANDWHTAAALYAVRRWQGDPFWHGVKTVFTVHNLGYMGGGADHALWAYGLPPIDDPLLPRWALHQPMPLGLWSADKIVAVSPSYAEEIQTPEYGYGLERFLQANRDRITGIVNGIDVQAWDPTKDDAIKSKFTSSDLSGRQVNKVALQEQFGLKVDPNIPLMAMVTRMDQQKGVDIAVNALRRLNPGPEWQAILLGTGNAGLEEAARRLESDFPQQVAAVIRFDARLSRQIYSGSDIFLMPSRYEPCGLTQMLSMRYGAIPVARATGGLRDTIADGRTGFLFNEASPTVMAASIRRALHAFDDKEKWREMQRTAMAEDFSWERSAQQYSVLYDSLFTDPQ